MFGEKMTSLVLHLIALKPYQRREDIIKTVKEHYLDWVKPDRLSSAESILSTNVTLGRIEFTNNRYTITQAGKNFIKKYESDMKQLAIYHYIFCNTGVNPRFYKSKMSPWIEKIESSKLLFEDEVRYFYIHAEKVEIEDGGYALTKKGIEEFKRLLFYSNKEV